MVLGPFMSKNILAFGYGSWTGLRIDTPWLKKGMFFSLQISWYLEGLLSKYILWFAVMTLKLICWQKANMSLWKKSKVASMIINAKKIAKIYTLPFFKNKNLEGKGWCIIM